MAVLAMTATPTPAEVVVQACRSVISPGTELAHYRGDSLVGDDGRGPVATRAGGRGELSGGPRVRLHALGTRVARRRVRRLSGGPDRAVTLGKSDWSTTAPCGTTACGGRRSSTSGLFFVVAVTAMWVIPLAAAELLITLSRPR
jgi:hypothetical protein